MCNIDLMPVSGIELINSGVDLEEASPPLQYQVRKYGRLLVDKDKNYRVNFEVRSRRDYFDLQYFYRLQKEAMFKKLGESDG